MISSFSTYIQFLAAIYVTLSFDNKLFRGLWSMPYIARLENFLKDRKVTINKPITEHIKSKARAIETGSMNRGLCCLLFCVLTMWHIGNEQHLSTNCEVIQLHMQLKYAISLAMFTIVMIFYILWFQKTIYTIFSFILIILSYVIFSFIHIEEMTGLFTFYLEKLPIIASVIIVLPLLMQFIIQFLYSKNYACMLYESFGKEIVLYEKAIKAKEGKDVPPEYQTAFTEGYFDRINSQSDKLMTSIVEIFTNRILHILNNIKFKDIVKFSITNLFKEKGEYYQLEGNEIQGDEIPKLDVSKYYGKIKEYEALQPKIKIDAFCSKEGLDAATFRKMRNNHVI